MYQSINQSINSSTSLSIYPSIHDCTADPCIARLSDECKQRMHQLYLESTLDCLLRTEEGHVKKHALKVLWVLRDHDQAVASAEAAVAELDKVRAITDRYQLSVC